MMALRIGPKAPEQTEVSAKDPSPADIAKEKKPLAPRARAMEKPPMLDSPRDAESRPRPGPAGVEPSAMERHVGELRAALREGGPGAKTAADQALALAASYTMRRSRGARQRGIGLCEEVADGLEELSELATKLRWILEAEARLQETTAESTLEACLALVHLLEKEADRA